MNKFTLIIIIVLIGMGGLIYKTASQKDSTGGSLDKQAALQISKQDHVLGNPDSKVVLFEYADFECPACGSYHPLVNELANQYADDIAIVQRHFPLSFHKNAWTSAQAVEAAGMQGKYHEMANLVYANQSVWANKSADIAMFDSMAELLELDMERYHADAQLDTVKKRIQDDINSAYLLGVNSTPSFYLGGVKIQNPQSLEEFSALIDAEIAKNASEPVAE